MDVTGGKVLIQRFFDIAEAIDLKEAEPFGRKLARRARFAGNVRHIDLPNPPLEIPLGPRGVDVLNLGISEVLVRVYDVGALVVTFVVDIRTPMPGNDLIVMAQRIAEGEADITNAARAISDEVRLAFKDAITPGEVADDVVEDYTIFYIRDTHPKLDAQGLQAALDIPRLLMGETEPLAAQERTQLMHAQLSYRPDDLVVVEWNSAVVLEPTGAPDAQEILELATIQMLELRVYDRLVGKGLDSLYKELEGEQYTFFRSSRYRKLSRRIMQLYVDVSEITERIDNAFTFLGDSFLARIHRAAVSEFGIPHWQKQLRSKLEVLRQINELLVNQITSTRSLSLEGAIVFLIILEIILAVFRGV